jgi:hypothetical protein
MLKKRKFTLAKVVRAMVFLVAFPSSLRFVSHWGKHMSKAKVLPDPCIAALQGLPDRPGI